MNDVAGMTLAWVVGGLLGAFFFGGLWWTLRRGVASQRPALWFLGSLLARVSATLFGFYFVSDGRWERMLLCLLGFMLARGIVTRLIRTGDQACALVPIK